MATTASFQGKPPYLTVWDVISLGWLYYPILSLLFVAFSLWIAARSASDGVEDAKRSLLTSCGAAEKAATVAASLPRWMAQSTNEELNEAIRQSIEASHSALEAVYVQLYLLFTICGSWFVDVPQVDGCGGYH